ncbi:MAG: VanZ family protein [Flavobacteriaceae bacterium]|nr:VanZ family protein [Flavobacteriaceae bacterium]
MNKFNLIVALTYSALIIYLGLSESDSISFSNFRINDKLAHLLSYLFFYFLWQNFFVSWFNDKALTNLFVFALTFGILIELGQKYLTLTRSAEFLDVVFNLIGILLVHIYFNLKKKKDLKL